MNPLSDNLDTIVDNITSITDAGVESDLDVNVEKIKCILMPHHIEGMQGKVKT
jgi:hypothetical protein